MTPLLVALLLTTADPSGPRLRLGIGHWGGGPHPLLALLSAGVSTHAGVQLYDRVAFYALVNGALGPFSRSLVGGAIAEVAITDWLAFGIGPGASYVQLGGRDVTVALGAPSRLTVMLGNDEAPGQSRHRFYVAADGFVGKQIQVPRGDATYVVGLSLGWQMM